LGGKTHLIVLVIIKLTLKIEQVLYHMCISRDVQSQLFVADLTLLFPLVKTTG